MKKLIFLLGFCCLAVSLVAARSETVPAKPSGIFGGLFDQKYKGRIVKESPPACSGHNLIDELSPDEKKQLQQKAKAIINGQGRFWKIKKPGKQTSWLFGTMHITDDRVNTLTMNEQNALNGADRIVLELEEISNKNGELLTDKALSNPNTFMVPDGKTIKDLLPADEFEHLRTTLDEHGLPYGLIARTQPWAIWTMLSIPSCEVLRTQMGLEALDRKIGMTAKQSGKPVIGLETIDEQLSSIQKLPLSFHVHAILDAIKDSTYNQNLFYTQTELYLQGNIAMIMALDEVFKGKTTKEDIEVFKTILLDQRNARMAERAAPLLEKGNSFIAVGAAHLPGETGLIEHFRKMGYQVSRAD